MSKPISLLSRRTFLAETSALAGMLVAAPLINNASGLIKPESYTVQQVIDLFISDVAGGALANTVDTLKAGNPDTVITGIVTTMFATIAVIREAIDLGANFIIAHEPTFYSHTDDVSWLKNDQVYRYKAELLKQHQIAIWRNHDYVHRLVPDGVTMGVLSQLGWTSFADKTIPNIITISPTPLKDLIVYTKEKLHIEKVRFIGDAAQPIERILLIPGAAGGRQQIESIAKIKPDVLICGEVSEWETAEYVRDARAKGDNLSLVILGHIASEEPGSEFMLNWLKRRLPAVEAWHISPGNSLSFM